MSKPAVSGNPSFPAKSLKTARKLPRKPDHCFSYSSQNYNGCISLYLIQKKTHFRSTDCFFFVFFSMRVYAFESPEFLLHQLLAVWKLFHYLYRHHPSQLLQIFVSPEKLVYKLVWGPRFNKPKIIICTCGRIRNDFYPQHYPPNVTFPVSTSCAVVLGLFYTSVIQVQINSLGAY